MRWASHDPSSSTNVKRTEEWVFSTSKVEQSHLGGETTRRPWHAGLKLSLHESASDKGRLPLLS